MKKVREKKTFFCAAILDNFQTKMFISETTSFHYCFFMTKGTKNQQGPKKFGLVGPPIVGDCYCVSGSGSKWMIKFMSGNKFTEVFVSGNKFI